MTNFLLFRRGNEVLGYNKYDLKFEGNAFLPSKAFIPLTYDTMLSPAIIVSKGDTVREGQLIAASQDRNSPNVHSSVPGIVSDFVTFNLSSGKSINTIAIEIEGSFDILGKPVPHNDWKELECDEILQIIKNSGVINTGDFLPQTLSGQIDHFKTLPKKICCINLFDVNPTCGLDNFLITAFFEQVMEGLAIIAKILEPDELICLHKFSSKETSKLKTIPSICGSGVKLLKISPRYPFGSIDLVTAQNVFWIDVSSALYVYEAVARKQPITSVYVAVEGKAVSKPKVLKVRVGTPIGSLIEECGGLKTKPEGIIVNGLFKGFSVGSFSFPIQKTTKSVHISPKETLKHCKIHNCIKCGRCFNVCPLYINPIKTVRAIERKQFTEETVKSINMCKNCLCCSSVCSARIPLSQIINLTKTELRESELVK